VDVCCFGELDREIAEGGCSTIDDERDWGIIIVAWRPWSWEALLTAEEGETSGHRDKGDGRSFCDGLVENLASGDG